MLIWVSLLAVAGGLSPAAPSTVDAVRLPPGLTWVARAPGAASATLFRVAESGVVDRQPLPYAVNAIGCGPGGTVYGLASRQEGTRLAGGPHLVRIPLAGPAADLGPVAVAGPAAANGDRYPLATGYAGAVSQVTDTEVRMLVGTAGGLREIRVGAGSAELVATREVPALPYVGDWASAPDGDLYTVVGSGDTAYLVRLRGAAAEWTPLPGLPAGPGYGGVALGPDRVLYAWYNRAGGESPLYAVPLDEPDRAAAIGVTDPAESTDATVCALPAAALPVRAAAVPSPEPRPRPARRWRYEPVPPAPAPPAAVVASRARVRPAVAAPARPEEPFLGKRLIPIITGVLLLAGAAVRVARRGRR